MHLFFSVGEPSGDQHAAHLIAEIRRRQPQARMTGFGGSLMERAGCERLFPLTDHAVMGVFDVLPLLLMFVRLVRQAGRFFDEQRPDAVVLIDYPGFNWWIARQAKKRGIPVIYYLPPQLWAWAPWRIAKIRKFVDHVLSALSFEVEWYRRRGIEAEFVGHPFFDEVARHKLDRDVLDDLKRDGRRVVGILPGSRKKEVTRNFPVMLRMIRHLQTQHADVRFVVACYKAEHHEMCQQLMQAEDETLPLELLVGRTSEIIEAAECCLMVSGSVSLELLARETPGVVIYHGTRRMHILRHIFVRCRYLTLVNLLAGRELMPEFPFVIMDPSSADAAGRILSRWLNSPAEREDVIRELADLKRAVAQPGGIDRAATAILAKLPATLLMRAA